MKNIKLFLILVMTLSLLFVGMTGCKKEASRDSTDIYNSSSEASENPESQEEPKSDSKGTPEKTPEDEPGNDSGDTQNVDSYEGLSYGIYKDCGEGVVICRDRESDWVFVIEKDDESDFVVINFADIQIDNVSDLNEDRITSKTMDDAVKTYSPSLITVSGDQIYRTNSTACLDAVIAKLDGYKIPWAWVYGNHDREYTSKSIQEKAIQSSKYGFIAAGPQSVDGFSNYVIKIVNKGTEEVVHSLVMLDSGMKTNEEGKLYDYFTAGSDLPRELDAIGGIYYDKATGRLTISRDYDNIVPSQIEWYEGVIESLNEQSGHMVETTCIFHIPLPEYYYAFKTWLYADDGGRAEMEPKGSIAILEDLGLGNVNHGFFAKMQELGSTKNVICGHDHKHDFSLKYEGIRLTYAVKCGDGGYWLSDGSKTGCSAVIIGSDGSAEVEQHYYREK